MRLANDNNTIKPNWIYSKTNTIHFFSYSASQHSFRIIASQGTPKTMLDSKTNLPKGHSNLSYHTKTNTRYPYNDTMNLGTRARQTAQNYAVYKASDGASKTRNDHEDDNTDEGLPPTWRAREIERGRIELMEKVKSMPESCYELSLKDIVEKPVEYLGSPAKEEESPRESVSSQGSKRQSSGISSGSFKRRSDVKSQMMMRNGSIGSGGLLLKMVFPVSLGPGNSISHNTGRLSTTGRAKVSPRPSYSDDSEKDWFRRAFSPTMEKGKPFVGSPGKTKSSRSNNDKIGTRQGNGCCWPFCWAKRSKLKG